MALEVRVVTVAVIHRNIHQNKQTPTVLYPLDRYTSLLDYFWSDHSYVCVIRHAKRPGYHIWNNEMCRQDDVQIQQFVQAFLDHSSHCASGPFEPLVKYWTYFVDRNSRNVFCDVGKTQL
uniref:Sulfotransfer_1 domain-containing protein n=1 Tax=Steinernema glaseri TaxID=37863 RepID=A0A1I7ZDN5_9BILA